jgi:hypothetical protein
MWYGPCRGLWSRQHDPGRDRWFLDPSTGCLTDVTAVREVALVSDPTSTLTLALTDGLICNNKGSATFTISNATGAVARLVVLPGTVRVTLIPGVPGDSAQYRATIVS